MGPRRVLRKRSNCRIPDGQYPQKSHHSPRRIIHTTNPEFSSCRKFTKFTCSKESVTRLGSCRTSTNFTHVLKPNRHRQARPQPSSRTFTNFLVFSHDRRRFIIPWVPPGPSNTDAVGQINASDNYRTFTIRALPSNTAGTSVASFTFITRSIVSIGQGRNRPQICQ